MLHVTHHSTSLECHDDCHRDSVCHNLDYIQLRVRLTDKKKIEVYENALQSTTIYRYVEPSECTSTLFFFFVCNEYNIHTNTLSVPRRFLGVVHEPQDAAVRP